MSKAAERFDRAAIGLVAHLNGSQLVVVVLLLYPGIGLLVPLVLGWPTIWLIEANVLCTVLAFAVLMGWASLRVDAAKKRHLVDWTTDLRLLDADEFEWFVGETFRREGWNVKETGHQDAPDGNIDLELTGSGQRKIVQCKRWTATWVGVDQIREFGGTLLREGLPANSGIFVTLSDFTKQARDEAKTAGISLVDGRDLYAKVDKVRRPELCEICQKPMLLGRSQHGWWFRCVNPGCNGKRHLGAEPGRAIELLTESPLRTG